MNCDICGKNSNDKRICDRCSRIMEKVIREVGPDLWSTVDDCKYIYPMIKRVADGSLRSQDVVNSLLKGEMD